MTTATIARFPASGPVRRVSAGSALRLTRRGRLAVVLAALVSAVLGSSLLGSSQAAGPGSRPAQRTVTVQPGESLWQVAVRVAPHADPRLIVTEIEQANHLAGPQVFGGQQLRVPPAG
ncbi:MAG: LysM peptidoglycan-binding domain-containing protein [Frankiales bacterium]|nr:LysM peptidoglycan-binding domain-containing protein [Frankiales bacterium]